MDSISEIPINRSRWIRWIITDIEFDRLRMTNFIRRILHLNTAIITGVDCLFETLLAAGNIPCFEGDFVSTRLGIRMRRTYIGAGLTVLESPYVGRSIS